MQTTIKYDAIGHFMQCLPIRYGNCSKQKFNPGERRNLRFPNDSVSHNRKEAKQRGESEPLPAEPEAVLS
jgi:hypothetical protein